ncbi:MAG: hypothetical protein HPY50_22075 [Firmicutes bacterium]|nr:hypothetical protein [Bacillota bacterium]
MPNFASFSGLITRISDFYTRDERNVGCYKLMSVQNRRRGQVNFVVRPDTYFVDQAMMAEGEAVIGFYDADAPVPLIYPPQYEAVVMARASRGESVKVDYFDTHLVSSDGQLRLNISSTTKIIQENGQLFTGDLGNRYLTVVYGPTTRSIPAQTTPYEVIVMCRLE